MRCKNHINSYATTDRIRAYLTEFIHRLRPIYTYGILYHIPTLIDELVLVIYIVGLNTGCISVRG